MKPEAAIGIDIGSKGGAALITQDRLVLLLRFGKLGWDDICATLALWAVLYRVTCFRERVNDRPGHSTQRTFRYGQNDGFVQGGLIMLQACGIIETSTVPVESKTWQYELRLGGKQGPLGCTEDQEYAARKRAHKIKADELFGDKLKVTLDGADALLIAEYGWRALFGRLTHGKSNAPAKPGTGIKWSETVSEMW